eukprot:Em0001g991a
MLSTTVDTLLTHLVGSRIFGFVSHTTQVFTRHLGFSPSFFTFGRHVNLPVDLMNSIGLKEEIAVPEYAKKLKGELLETYAQVKERCMAEHRRQKSIYDRKVHEEPINCGDLAWLHSPAEQPGNPRSFTSLGRTV